MLRLLRRLFGLLCCVLPLLAWAAAPGATDGLVAVPPLTAQVTDLTATLDAAQQAALEQKLAAFEARKGAQVAVLILPTTQPETIEQFGIRLLDAWKIGRKGVDDGALLIVARDDRKLRIEVGYGLEGALNDATAKRIIDESMAPLFKAGDLPGGVAAGVDAMLKVIDGESLPAPLPASSPASDGPSDNLLFGLLLAVVIVGSILRQIFGRLLGSSANGLLAGGVGWLVMGNFMGFLAGALAGFMLAMIGLENLLRLFLSVGGGGRGGGGSFGGGGGRGGGGGASGGW
ncbi:MAG: YgcG family protein [Azonexus sp.]